MPASTDRRHCLRTLRPRPGSLWSSTKAEHDLQLAGFAVAIVAEFGERAGAPLEIGRGDVIEHQRAVLEVASRQCFLDALLLFDEPVERIIKRPLVDCPQFQHRAQNSLPSRHRAGAPLPAWMTDR